MTTKGSNNPFPSILLNEVATDGSDTPTPAADYRRLFLGEDGELHLIDSADVVTDVSGAGGSVATDAIWDAAGDLAVGSGANTAAKLAIGTTNRLLKVVAGTAAWALPHAFGCIVSGTSTALTTAQYNSLAFGAADTYDPDAYHDPASGNTLITIPAGLGGVYGLKIRVTHPNTTAADTEQRIGYRINGGTDINLDRHRYAGVIGIANYRTASVDIVLAAGDTVEVRQWITNTTSPQTTTEYSASLFLIGIA